MRMGNLHPDAWVMFGLGAVYQARSLTGKGSEGARDGERVG